MAGEYNLRTHAAFAAALGRIAALGREPTPTEQDFLAHALAYMACGSYRLARAQLREFSRAMLAGDTRPATAMPATTMPAKERPFTMALLRRGHLRLGAFV